MMKISLRIIMIIVMDIVFMQIYLKRSLEGRLRASSDTIGGQFAANASRVWLYTGRDANLSTVERTHVEKGNTTSTGTKNLIEKRNETVDQSLTQWPVQPLE